MQSISVISSLNQRDILKISLCFISAWLYHGISKICNERNLDHCLTHSTGTWVLHSIIYLSFSIFLCLDTNYLQTAGRQWLIFKKEKKNHKKVSQKTQYSLEVAGGKKTRRNKRRGQQLKPERFFSRRACDGRHKTEIHPRQFLDQKNIGYQEDIPVHKSSSVQYRNRRKNKFTAEESYESLRSKRQVVWHKDKNLKRLFLWWIMKNWFFNLKCYTFHFTYTRVKIFQNCFLQNMKVWRCNQQTHKRKSLTNG